MFDPAAPEPEIPIPASHLLALLGTPDELKKLVVHEASHSFPNTDRARESLAWLDQHLGPVP